MVKIVSSFTQDPYLNNKDYHEVKRKYDKIYKNQQYTKITYQKEHGCAWRVGQGILALFASVSVLPLIINFKAVKGLWKNAHTGKEKKVILVAQKKILEPKNQMIQVPSDHKLKSIKPEDLKTPKKTHEKKVKNHVEFDKARVR